MNQIKRSYAIVIGINNYTNDIPPLKTAVNDAKRFAKILTQSYQYQVLELLDIDATQSKLNNLIENLKQGKLPLSAETITIEENDRLLFYFAGHGIALDGLESEDGQATGYLLPQDAHKHENSFLPMQLLHDALVALDCRHLLVILDCCFAGAFRWSSLTREARRYPKMYRERYDRYIKGCAQQVITSAAHDEKAVDVLSRLGDRGVGNTGEHSPFAEILFQALENGSGNVMKDGVITASELYVYLDCQLGKRVHRQTPGLCQLKKHDKGEFIFLVPDFDPKNLENAPPLDENKNPYRGLKPYEFNEEDRKFFFGRKQAIENLKTHLLNSQNPLLTVVLGASGIGKSSLVKAGLLPSLSKEQWQWHILSPMRPDSSPFTALASIILPIINQSTPDHSNSIHTLSQQLRQPQKLREIINSWSRHNSSKLLLVIDQFEELVTMCQPEEKNQFLDLLKALLTDCSEHLRILITLRSDFEPYFSNKLLSSNRWMAARFVIPLMEREELREVIEEPAAKKVLYFDPPQLVERLLDDVAQMPGALPLLSFTLSELYLKYLYRRENDRALRQEDYEDLGGVIGSLTKRATQEYEELVSLNSAYKKTVRQVMLRMVALEGGESARRRVPKSELKYADADENERVEGFLNRFSQARLIVGDKDFEGKPYFEPAHDALVRGWDKLQTWIKLEQKTLTVQERLTSAVNDWLDSSDEEQKKRFLWTNDPRLEYLEKLLQSEGNWLNEVEIEFVKQSIQHRNNQLERAKQQLDEARQGEISALVALSEARFQNEQLEALIYSLKAGRLLQQIKRSPWLKEDVVTRTSVVLQQTLRRVEEYNRLEMHQGGVNAIDFLSDGQMIATEDREGIIRIWQLDGTLHQTLEDKRYHLSELAKSPDGQMIASRGKERGTIHLWNHDGSLHKTLEVHGNQVMKILFSPDNQIFATASWEHDIKLWKRDGTLYKTLKGHQDAVTTLDFSSDGEMIASASTDGTVRLWKSDGTLLRTFTGHRDAVWSVCISPNGSLIASGGQDTTVKLWKRDGTLVKTFYGHKSAVRALRFSPDGQILASGSDDETVKLWKIGGTSLKILDGHIDVVYDVCFSPDGKTIATTHGHGQISLWNSDGTLIKTEKWQGGPITAVDFSPNGEMIATASGDRSVQLRSSDGAFLRTLEGHTGAIEHKEILGLSFSPDSQMIATGSVDGSIRLWTTDGKLHSTLQEQGSTVRGVCFSPDGEMIASGGDDTTVKLWKQDGESALQEGIPTQATGVGAASPFGAAVPQAQEIPRSRSVPEGHRGTLLLTLTGHKHSVCAVCFSPNGSLIASASADGTVKLWKQDGTLYNTLTGHRNVMSAVRFSPDGTFIATASYDNTVKLWKLDGTLYKTLHGHSDRVYAVAFSPDGKTIASASTDKTAILWNLDIALDLDKLLTYGCNWVRDYLNHNPNGQKERWPGEPA